MKKVLAILLSIILFLLISGCGKSDNDLVSSVDNFKQETREYISDKITETVTDTLTDELKEEATVQISQLAGLPKDKVKEYLEMAEKTLADIGLIYTEEENTAFNFIFNKASAEEDQNIEKMTVEAETYIELAIESAEEITATEEASDALELIQETQDIAVETYEEALNEATEVEAETLQNAIEETENTIDDVDENLSEIEDAIENGETSVEIDIETDIEDQISNNTGNIKIPIKFKKRAANKIQRVKDRLDTLLESGENEELASFLAEKIEKAEKLMASGTVAEQREAFRAAKSAIKEHKKDKIIRKRLKNNPNLKKTILEKAKNMELPKDLQNRITELKENGNDIAAYKLIREIKVKTFKKAAQDLRKEKIGEKREAFKEIKNIRSKIKTGNLTEEEARNKIKDIQNNRINKLKILKDKHREEIKDLSKKAARNFNLKNLDVKPALKNPKTLKKIKKSLTDEQKEVIKERRAEFKDSTPKEKKALLNETKKDIIQNKEKIKKSLSDKQKRALKERKENITEKKENIREIKKDVKELKKKLKKKREQSQ